ncbi:Rho-GAP domain-containing protein [Entamoeba marina]
MQKNIINSIWLLSGRHLKETTLQLFPFGNVNSLVIGKNTQINLAHANITLNHKHLKYVPTEYSKQCFVIVYKKDYIVVCRSPKDYLLWIHTLSRLSNTIGSFGFPLQCAVQKSGWRFPIVVYRCIEYLTKCGGLSTEGIFRTNPSVQTLSEVKQILESDNDISLDEFVSCRIAAALLKEYLRSLPEPLITFDLYSEYIKLSKISFNESLNFAKSLVNMLPPLNQDVLWYTCSLLKQIIQNEKQTLMTINNIATCVGLIIAKPPPTMKVDEMTHTQLVIASFCRILENYDVIFESIRQRNETIGMTPPTYPAIQPTQTKMFQKHKKISIVQNGQFFERFYH